MSLSATEAAQESWEQLHGYGVDVVCWDCGDAAVVRFINGEPLDESSMVCHCSGEMEIL